MLRVNFVKWGLSCNKHFVPTVVILNALVDFYRFLHWWYVHSHGREVYHVIFHTDRYQSAWRWVNERCTAAATLTILRSTQHKWGLFETIIFKSIFFCFLNCFYFLKYNLISCIYHRNFLVKTYFMHSIHFDWNHYTFCWFSHK